ncbi:hypothetical protein [Photorhabdus sp. S14-60]|uniref:hypothetical protein n=1 Tax=Photorhabdus sp. S14-60 TaxID=2029689 RepID=UPI001313F33E|nr:hypothetical protein [Photorhabdus sp. S14-60]NDK94340.1 hypothetical protein [Photorhabdus laumondii subsp. laumondii]
MEILIELLYFPVVYRLAVKVNSPVRIFNPFLFLVTEILGILVSSYSIIYTQWISRCIAAARERIPGSIDNYVTGVSECSQQRSNLKDDGYKYVRPLIVAIHHFMTQGMITFFIKAMPPIRNGI